MFDIVGKAKWQAWSDVSALSSEEAEKQCVVA
jgi:acyl-CoA-binding protein